MSVLGDLQESLRHVQGISQEEAEGIMAQATKAIAVANSVRAVVPMARYTEESGPVREAAKKVAAVIAKAATVIGAANTPEEVQRGIQAISVVAGAATQEETDVKDARRAGNSEKVKEAANQAIATATEALAKLEEA